MANQYILVFRDQAGNLRLVPEALTVSFQDTVIWVSNLGENYEAGNFVPTNPPGPTLFQQPSFSMPAEGQSTPGVVLPEPSAKIAYSYTCSDVSLGAAATTTDDSVSGIVIVDPTGPGEPKEKQRTQQAVQSSNGKSVQQTVQVNGVSR